MSGTPANAIAGKPASPRASRASRAERASRCLSWLGAVVLLVLVATAGLPDARRGVVAAPAIASVEAVVATHPAFAVGEPPALPARVAAEVTVEPRVPGRARSVQARGLPPPRAPCA